MIAFQLHGPRDLRLEEVEEAPVGPQDVRVKVAQFGVCPLDIFYYFAEETGFRRPRNIGHEIAGVVAEVGSEVSRVAPGDRVVVFPVDHCGSCRQCLDGYPIQCENLDRSVSTVGCGSPIGGMAEYCVVPERLVLPLPAEVTMVQGALVEPLGVGANAVMRAAPGQDSSAVVLGGRPIAIGVVLALEAMGVSTIIVIEDSPRRREVFERISRARAIAPSREDAPAVVRQATDGRGADLVFECDGSTTSLSSAFELVRNRGTIVCIGLHQGPYPLDQVAVALRELSIIGHDGATADSCSRVIEWMARGQFPAVDSWVDHLPLERTVEGFQRMYDGDSIKVVIDMPVAVVTA